MTVPVARTFMDCSDLVMSDFLLGLKGSCREGAMCASPRRLLRLCFLVVSFFVLEKVIAKYAGARCRKAVSYTRWKLHARWHPYSVDRRLPGLDVNLCTLTNHTTTWCVPTSDKTRPLVITQTNCEYLPLTLNMLDSLASVGGPSAQVIAEDCASYHFLKRRGLNPCPPLEIPDSGSGKTYNTMGFHMLTSLRPHYLRFFVERGWDSLWLDSDVVTLQNPLAHIPRAAVAVFSDDRPPGRVGASSYICSCFIFLRKSNATLRLLDRWLLHIPYAANDQPALNRAVGDATRRFGLRHMVLARELFPNGALYPVHKGTAAWAHANFRKGLAAKEKFFSDHQLLRPVFAQAKQEITCGG